MNIPPLIAKKCAPCGKDATPLSPAAVEKLLPELRGWTPAGGKALRQELLMKDFMAGIRFIQAIAQVAESEGHHPDLHLAGYRRLTIELSTHSIGGLSENDFILAAKIDALPRELGNARPARRI